MKWYDNPRIHEELAGSSRGIIELPWYQRGAPWKSYSKKLRLSYSLSSNWNGTSRMQW